MTTTTVSITPQSIARAVAPPNAPEYVSTGLFTAWWPVLLGWCVMYLPTYYDLARYFWTRQDSSHGPLILAVVAWLIWRERETLREPASDVRPVLGGVVLGLGLLCYVIGRSQQFFVLEAISQLPVLFGAVLLTRGMSTAKAIWFPIFFLIFVTPLPGSVLNAILLPLKQWVSMVVDSGLYTAGFPISRSGVVLQIGPYQLLIADACSGLNSMIALSAVGVLFTYLVRRNNPIHDTVLLLSVLPIAFAANILRVTTLVLTTHYFGYDIADKMHDYAGYAEIAFAFCAFFVLDSVLWRIAQRKEL